jgi:flagellar FliJ protein
MAKFVYRMQNILNMKQKLENQAKAAYGLADKKYQEEQAKLQELLVRKSGYDRHLKELMNGIIDLEAVHHAKDASEAMKVLIRRQMVEVHKAQLELEAARKQLIDVRKERKMHEKLREKAYDAYLVEENRREGKEVDQLVSYTYNAK